MRVLVIVSLFGLLCCWSCSDENEPTGTEITVQFRRTNQSISETQTADVIIIEFSSTADFNGFLEVELLALHSQGEQDIITQPATLDGIISVPISSGSSQATIVIAPTPDADSLTDTLQLTILGGNSLVKIGNNFSMNVFITESTNGGGGGNNTGSGTCSGSAYDIGTIQCSPSLSSDELNIVTWNIENFPMESNTVSKVVDIIRNLNADIVAVQEIGDISDFNSVVGSLNGYEGVATDVNGSIELGYIYKTSEILFFGTPTKLFTGQTSPFPREPVEVEITHANGLTLKLINIHLKCCDNGIARRTDASNKLKTYIDTSYPNEEVVVVGDWNEDFINGAGSFDNFINDGNYTFADYPINEGSSSNFSYPSWPSHLDHILVTDELCDNLVSTYTVRLDDCVSSYFSDVSDHRPVLVTLNPD